MEYQIDHQKELAFTLPSIVYDHFPVSLTFNLEVILLTFNNFDFTQRDKAHKESEQNKYTQVGALFDNQEAAVFASKPQIALRKRFSNRDWLKPFSSGSTEIRVDTRTDKYLPDPYTPTISTITRTFQSISLCFVVYFLCTILSTSKKARQAINVRSGPGVTIPTFFYEKLCSIRETDCNDFFITPGFTPISKDCLKFLGFEKTILDFEWVVSEDGVEEVFTFFSILASAPQNYIEFKVFEKPISFNGGTMTTETCISSTQISKHDSPRNYVDIVQLLPGNSYGNNVDGVQLNDAFVIPRVAYNSDAAQIPLNGYSPQFQSNLNSEKVTAFVVSRTTGVIHNKDRSQSIPLKKAVPNTSGSQEKEKSADHADDVGLAFSNIRFTKGQLKDASLIYSFILALKPLIHPKLFLALIWYFNINVRSPSFKKQIRCKLAT